MEAIVSVLQSCELFSACSPEDVAALAAVATWRELPGGSELFRQGAARHACYVVEKGQLEVLKDSGDGPERVILLREGSACGEAAFLHDHPHTVTVRTLTACRLLELDREKVVAALQADGRRAVSVLTAIALRVNRRLLYTGYERSGREQAFASLTRRTESDLLGSAEIYDDALFGVQTLRGMENFPITGVPLAHFPALVRALGMVKQATARANAKLGLLDPAIAAAIDLAAQEVIEGQWVGHFPLDIVQGGAGTSTNMNANEVIANRALEILGKRHGEYAFCHPNDHVNLGQSTNDVYPTAVRMATVFMLQGLLKAMERLEKALRAKGREFKDIIKMGRTQLQDAVPMTLGQEFEAFAVTTGEDIDRLHEISRLLLEINMGATAIGTGICADPRLSGAVVAELRAISALDLKLAGNLIEATSDTGAFVLFSGALKRAAVKLSKMCNDLRLLSSGPRCGLGEINLPARQPGSSIMPGKVNPVIPEVVNQVAFHVIGNDLTITLAAEAGQLQLNVMEPILAYNLFESLRMLTAAVNTLTDRCIVGITANADRCREMVEHSIGIVTALVPVLGYKKCTEVAKEALETGTPIRELVLRRGWLDAAQLDEVLSPEAMTQPRPLV